MTNDERDPVVFALDGMEEAMRAVLTRLTEEARQAFLAGVGFERELELLNCQNDLEALSRVRRLWAEMANSSTALIIAETMRKDVR